MINFVFLMNEYNEKREGGMKVCIAEKPSVAKDIAHVLGANQRKDGYFEGNGYQVTWTFGHLCTLKEPHDYFPYWKTWNLSTLPMIPKQFGIKLISNKGVEKQFKIIKHLVQNSTEVINCGDAGQEGELIQRWVLSKAKCKVPVKRLWISSLTEQAIREGFSNLKDAEQYKNLYFAGSARAIGDWLLGMNATRLFTKKFATSRTVLSIGRVQTPTLAMLVARQKEINAFISEYYWELKTVYKDTEFIASIDRLKSEERAGKGLAYLQEHLFEIISFDIKEGRERNPRLFDLTALQVEANKKYAYSADHTLKHIQSLYEKKLVTYPRVDTTFLTEDLYPKIPGILKSMQFYADLIRPILEEPIPKSKTIFDDTKVTDHHAIIPTEILPQNLSLDEKRIYDLVAKRFIAVFYPECIVSNTLVEAKVGEIPFKTSGKQIISLGWREVYAKEKKEEGEEKTIPVFVMGESGEHQPFVHKGRTTAPKPYTEATLLRAMETAGRQIEDEEMREALKDNGIGRPSTRANIIETLFRRKYIERKRRNIFATQTGIDLIDVIQDELLKSPELTGTWERKLRLMEKGEYELDVFKKELIDMVIKLTEEVKQNRYAQPIRFVETAKEKKATRAISKVNNENKKTTLDNIQCPKCKNALLLKGNKAYGCANYNQCGFKVPFEIYTKKLTANQLVLLLTKRKTRNIKGFQLTEQAEKTEGILILDDDFKIKFIEVIA